MGYRIDPETLNRNSRLRHKQFGRSLGDTFDLNNLRENLELMECVIHKSRSDLKDRKLIIKTLYVLHKIYK